jgi:hypothetical protein
MALAKLSSGGGFFKAKDHTDAEVILFEPKRFEAQVPSNYGEQDVVTADVTVWKTLDSEPEVNTGMRIAAKAIVRDLEPLVRNGDAVAAKVVYLANKKGGNDFPVLRAVDAKAEAAVEQYLTERDKAMEEAPF